MLFIFAVCTSCLYCQVYVGVIANLIEFPVNFILVLLFKKSRRRKPPPNKLEEAVKVALKKAEPDMSEAELRRIIRVTGDSSKKTPAAPVASRDDPFGNAKKKKKMPFSLPWWCRIVAWVLLWLAVCACATFVLFFAITFGDTKTRKWITSLVISFATAIFLTQPAKVSACCWRLFLQSVCK